ncbi:MAG: periplasmic heavy metal sensor [Brevundimonas sp.]|uniref:periplasmic heavy metal sensor n=1 Tax=Brevundimonas sp. TaxID=1871086 RepID=UPI0025BDD040|nr:periplasmic heavy metal sensor [Brevundimonas sp.]MBX3477939.1 periplasmic heavy metal sensor [Brevundimonas sp.]
MTGRTLKILLAVSVALNLFALAGGVTLYAARAKVERQVEDQARPGRGQSFMGLTDRLSPEARDRVRTALRQSAHAARPDFDAARAARREAVTRSRAETYDPAAIQALLEQSRLAEMRGRARLESDLLALMNTLSPADRAVMSRLLARRSGRGPGGVHGGPHGPRDAQPDGPPPSAD